MTNINNIQTYGIKYAGSKLKLLPYIYEITKDLDINNVLDGFSGTTRVSQLFAQMGYTVTCIDKAEWSKVFGECFLLTTKPYSYYQPIIDELNSLSPVSGWFTQTYSLEESDLKKAPFQYKNLMKLDAIREHIEKQNYEEEDKSVLLTSLILGLDKIDNTIGHFTSYLSKWSARSYNNLVLEVPKYNIYTTPHQVKQDDIFNVVNNQHYDLAYFDPPYGSNNEKMPSSRVRYNGYYHFWKSVILYDKAPVFGKAHRREDSRDLINPSIFEDYHQDSKGCFLAIKAIEELLTQTDSEYILFSYSNGGRATKEQLYEIFTQNCKILNILEINYKSNVMTSMKWTNEWNRNNTDTVEYLFLLQKL